MGSSFGNKLILTLGTMGVGHSHILQSAPTNNTAFNAHKFLPFKTSKRNGRFSRRTILVFLLLIIVIVLVILIAVTYGKKLQCDDDDRNNREHTRRKEKIHLRNPTT